MIFRSSASVAGSGEFSGTRICQSSSVPTVAAMGSGWGQGKTAIENKLVRSPSHWSTAY